MSCKQPLKGFIVGKTENGKNKIKLADYSLDFIEYQGQIYTDWIQIPCGKCVGCRLNYSRTWADRCVLESLFHENNYFVTLTYSDLNVPISYYSDPVTGEAIESLTLQKRDIQLFNKRLRKEYGSFRFFCAGEYGGKSFRPHYHMLIFGINFKSDELKFYKKTNKYFYYTSDRFNNVWKKGYCIISPLSYATAAYTTRYCMKKAIGYDKFYYSNFGLQPEFTIMSRQPGIGRFWINQHIDDFMDYDYQTVSIGGDKPLKVFPNRYFDSVLEKKGEKDSSFAEKFEIWKQKRKDFAEHQTEMKLEQTDLDYLELLQVEEESLKRNVNFMRGDIDEA